MVDSLPGGVYSCLINGVFLFFLLGKFVAPSSVFEILDARRFGSLVFWDIQQIPIMGFFPLFLGSADRIGVMWN